MQAKLGHYLSNFSGPSHPQPVDIHPVLVYLEMVSHKKPPKCCLQFGTVRMEQNDCTIILKIKADKSQKLYKEI